MRTMAYQIFSLVLCLNLLGCAKNKLINDEKGIEVNKCILNLYSASVNGIGVGSNLKEVVVVFGDKRIKRTWDRGELEFFGHVEYSLSYQNVGTFWFEKKQKELLVRKIELDSSSRCKTENYLGLNDQFISWEKSIKENDYFLTDVGRFPHIYNIKKNEFSFFFEKSNEDTLSSKLIKIVIE